MTKDFIRDFKAWEDDYDNFKTMPRESFEISLFNLLKKHYPKYIFYYTKKSNSLVRTGFTSTYKLYVQYNTKEGFRQFKWRSKRYTIPDFCFIRWLVDDEEVEFTSTNKYYTIGSARFTTETNTAKPTRRSNKGHPLQYL